MSDTTTRDKERDNLQFARGMLAALAVVDSFGAGVVWREIADSQGYDYLHAIAKKDGCARWAGFTRNRKDGR